MRNLAVYVSVSLLALVALAPVAKAFDPEKFHIESAAVELSTTQAGAHPDFTTKVVFSETEGYIDAFMRDFVEVLPPGLFGNQEAFPKCTNRQFGTSSLVSKCPQDSQVGVVDVTTAGAFHFSFPDTPI